MKMDPNSPCAACRRVPCPAACNNKRCIHWLNWFEDRWAGIHGFYLRCKRQGLV